MGRKTAIIILILVSGLFASSICSHGKSAGNSTFQSAVHRKHSSAQAPKAGLVYPSILVF
jgi:hypothetical protein